MPRAAGAPRAGFVTALVGVAACAGLLLTAAAARADDATVTPTFRSSRTSAPNPFGAKLEQIEANDQRILAKFDEIMEEVRIVKIRVLRAPQTPPP